MAVESSDPCEKTPTDVIENMSSQEKERGHHRFSSRVKQEHEYSIVDSGNISGGNFKSCSAVRSNFGGSSLSDPGSHTSVTRATSTHPTPFTL